MKNIVLLGSLAFLANIACALDLNTVFENQKKASFPDTCEMHMTTTVSFPGAPSQIVNVSVISAGESVSNTTIKSTVMQMNMIRNHGRTKMVDLKTGKKLPVQNMPEQSPADVNKQMGSPEDYNAPVKISGSSKDVLWKLTPKDVTKPTLYYSSSLKRVVKMTAVVNNAQTESKFEYCDNSCPLPGTLKKTEITTQMQDGKKSVVTVDIKSAKQRHALPSSIFDVE